MVDRISKSAYIFQMQPNLFALNAPLLQGFTMKHFKVLGSCCGNCNSTADLIESKAKELGVEVEIEKVTDIADIMGYGVMSTPGVVLDEKVIHAGGMPTARTVEEWIR